MSACLRAAVASSTALTGVHLRPVAKVGALLLTTRSLDSFSVICTLEFLCKTGERQLEDAISIEAYGGKASWNSELFLDVLML